MKKKINQAGQSTVEFIFTFALGVSLIFLVFNSSINYVTGYLVHYATFMASRTYLTADFHTGTVANPGPSMNRTEELAQETFRRYMLQIFNPNIRVQINPPQGTPSDYLTTGAVSTFDLPMDIVGQITGQTILELTSESFLGKEPTRAQCAARTCFAMTGTNNCDNMDVTLYDDGC